MGKSWSRLRRSNDRIQTANLWGIPTVGEEKVVQWPGKAQRTAAFWRPAAAARSFSVSARTTSAKLDTGWCCLSVWVARGLAGGLPLKKKIHATKMADTLVRFRLRQLSHWWVRFGAEVYQTSWTEGIDVLSKDAIWAMKMTLLIWII